MTAHRRGETQLPLFDAADARPDAWNVRVSRRARRMSVRVYPGGRVDIVVPKGVRPQTIQRFVSDHQGWIAERVREMATLSAANDAGLPESLDLPALGECFRVDYRFTSGVYRVTVGAPDRLTVHGDRAAERACAHVLRQWLARRCKERFAARLDALSAITGLAYEALQIRRQRTRWGSCSVRGTISVNMGLAFLRPEVVDYLLLHELCHTRHMNHSRRFWALVEGYEPQCRDLDRELGAGWRNVPHWLFF